MRNAAKKMPKSDPKPTAEEIPELSQELLKEEPPEIPASKATKEDLEMMKGQVKEAVEEEKAWKEKIAESKHAAEKEEQEEEAEWDRKIATSKLTAERVEREKAAIDANFPKVTVEDAQAVLEARKNIENIPDMTAEAKLEEPDEPDKGWAGKKSAEFEEKKKQEGLAKSAKIEADRKKPWWKRLMDSLGG